MLIKTILEADLEAEASIMINYDEQEQLIKDNIPEKLSMLPLRSIVLFPGTMVPISAGRNRSVKLLKDAYRKDKIIGVLTQRDINTDNPSEKDLHNKGTVTRIVKLIEMPDGNATVILEGKCRFEVKKFTQQKPYFKAEVFPLSELKDPSDDKEYAPLVESVRDLAVKIVQENPNISSEIISTIRSIENYSFLMFFIAANIPLSAKEKQIILMEDDLKKRAVKTYRFLSIEYQHVRLKNDIQSRVRSDMDQQQREYFLQQQIKAIQEELGDISYEKEIEAIRRRGARKKWPKEAAEQFKKELLKLQRNNPQMPDYTVQRNYIDLMLDLPWQKYSKDYFDLKKAQIILDRDHSGLEKVKERIIEHLAVLKLRADMRSPILCFYGPPGVGKTSLGKSIAAALRRKYVRVSLGGVHDEGEIRGHRRTYVGAMPGRLIQSIKKSKTSNPVFLLDEIDKIGQGVHGDPSSAMLEVLDPEQNTSFYDNFLELGYDLSKVMFIATANSLSSIQPPLLDRMEVIEINGYTLEEKVEIASKYLLPRQLKEHGLKKKDLLLGKRQIEKIIESYTRESGVRKLEKQIAKLARHIAKNIATEQTYSNRLSVEDVEKVLGVPQDPERYEGNNVLGVVTGLAWTSVGGDILYIESILSKGKGLLTLTGNLGDVMKESATIALQYIKAHYEEFEIDPKLFEEQNIHIHIPEGAVPKDGPSAGVTMLTSLVSSYSGRKVKPHIAMTGEITLRGRVLPVGGIKEKILAAKRSCIKEIILSIDNQKDISDIKKSYLEGLTFHYVKETKEVIDLALLKKKIP